MKHGRFAGDITQNFSHVVETKNIAKRIISWATKNNIITVTAQSNLLSQLKNSKNDKFLCVFLVDLMPNFDYWKTISDVCITDGKIVSVITDTIFKDHVSFPGIDFYSFPKLLGATKNYSDYPLEPQTHERLYNSLVLRVESVRQSWFYFLHQHRLLDQGFVSFQFKQLPTYKNLSGYELLEWIHYNHGLDTLPHFHRAFVELQHQVPYCNFDTQSVEHVIEHSKYSLALETYATDDDIDMWIVYEKTLTPLQFATVPLLFCQKGAVLQCVKLGLEIPEFMMSIDQLSWQERQQSLLNILVNDTVEFSWQESKDRALYNRNLLLNWRQECHSDTFFDSAFDSIA